MRTNPPTDSDHWILKTLSTGMVVASVLSLVFFMTGCEPSSSPDEASEQAADKSATAADEEGGGEVGAVSIASSEPISPMAAAPPNTPEHGRQLYLRHCSACHGERGDGKGIAASVLFPKPRDFRAGRFRLVSTNNNVPTREDLHAVLLRGMPGSAMPPWSHLPEVERDALIDEVLRLRHEGIREEYVRYLKDDEELTDEEIAAEDVQEEIQEYVDEFTTPGESTDVPTIEPPTDDAILRGKEIYAKFACIQCHGETGRGDGAEPMVDDEGMPTRPRDFTLGIFKGNHDPASLYRRIAYGMPGTPMPGSSAMTPQQMVELVHYIRSLSTEQQRQAAILNRETIVVTRVDAIPDSTEGDAWAQIEPSRLRMTPLWWRNDADHHFTMQAVHDGETVAVRLTWKDETADRQADRSEAFADAVAMELYRGDPAPGAVGQSRVSTEPFLGMGDPMSPVDVWFWNADRQRASSTDEEPYPNAVVDVYPFSEAVVASAELNRRGARMADQPDVSLPARAAGNLVVPTRLAPDQRAPDSGGSSLQVGGPGSVTFRAPRNQFVQAHGAWSNGRWTVVMTRPLSIASQNGGVSLEPGVQASAAFAVWDGSHQDRNGQKSITIWQDLELAE